MPDYYNTNQFRGGLKIMLDGEPHLMLENEFVKPGKGMAFNRVKLRNLVSNRVIDRTYKSGENVESADVIETELQYLYNDGKEWHFMDTSSYEQYTASEKAIGDAKQWLKEEAVCNVTLYNNAPLLIEPPNFVELKVIETDPGVRGDTATGGSKPAKLETGAVIRVPLFIETDEILRIDTRTGEYVSRGSR